MYENLIYKNFIIFDRISYLDLFFGFVFIRFLFLFYLSNKILWKSCFILRFLWIFIYREKFRGERGIFFFIFG